MYHYRLQIKWDYKKKKFLLLSFQIVRTFTQIFRIVCITMDMTVQDGLLYIQLSLLTPPWS
jgi:hypothetical protein